MEHETPVRDSLAIPSPLADFEKVHRELDRDRTHLANQRTFLAYMRTALGVIVLAVFIFKFAPTVIGLPLGAITLVIALIIILYGVKDYRSIETKIGNRPPLRK